MVVFRVICKIFLMYILICLVLAVFDTCKTFYKAIKNEIKGNDDDVAIFGKLEMIFFPSILIYDGIFSAIIKIFNLPVDDFED